MPPSVFEQDRADRALARRRPATTAPAPSPNSDGGALVVGVGEAREDLGADDQHDVGAARLDLGGAGRERGEEAACRRRRCRRRRRRCRARRRRRGRRSASARPGVIVATRTRSTSAALRPASLERAPGGGDREVARALVVGGVAALADAGAARDPLRVDADALGDRAVGHDAVGQLVAEADDAGGARAARGAGGAAACAGDGDGSDMARARSAGVSTFVPGTMRLARRASTLPGPTSTKRSAPAVVQRGERLAPADGADRAPARARRARRRTARADAQEKTVKRGSPSSTSSSASRNGATAAAIDGRVEGAGDRQADGALAALAGQLARPRRSGRGRRPARSGRARCRWRR